MRLLILLFPLLLGAVDYPAPPTLYDPSFPLVSGTTRTVTDCADLQTTLDAAVPGDEVVLTYTLTCTGNYVWKKRSNPDSKWTLLRGSNLSSFAAETRISKTASLPTLLTTNGNPVLSNEYDAVTESDRASSYLWVAGIKMRADPVSQCYNVVLFSPFTGATTEAAVPHHITFDRVIVIGTVGKEIRRGINAEFNYGVVKDSQIYEIHSNANEAQGIGAINGASFFLVRNNFISAGGENIMWGGELNSALTSTPSDITVEYNHFWKDPQWYTDWSACQPTPGCGVVFKNLYEHKVGNRILVHSNVLENNWRQSQGGYGILMTPRSNGGLVPGAEVSDVLFANNTMRNVGAGFSLASRDSYCTAPGCATSARVALYNNLAEIDSSIGDGRGFLLSYNSKLSIERTSILSDYIYAGLFASDTPLDNFRFVNNVLWHSVSKDGVPGPAFAVDFTGTTTMTGNIFLALNGSEQSGWTAYDATAQFAASVAALDLATNNVAFAPTSPFYGQLIGSNLSCLDEAAIVAGTAPATACALPSWYGVVPVTVKQFTGLSFSGGWSFNAVVGTALSWAAMTSEQWAALTSAQWATLGN